MTRPLHTGRWPACWCLALALLVLVDASARAPRDSPVPAVGELARGLLVVRVYYDRIEDVRALSDFDVLEDGDSEEGYVRVLVRHEDYGRLQRVGMRLRIDAEQTAELNRIHRPFLGQRSGIPGFPCYRTVEETFATAAQLAADHPDLASWIDFGDSWEKSTGPGGYDMRVLRLTQSAVAGPKPKLIVTASIHAREYAPAELLTRFAELLLDGYDYDADATWLLDHHEVHLVLQGNPDGRKHAEAGEFWRKNTNTAYCGVTSSNRGADLNRNFEFQWGCCGGSSPVLCSENYRGPAPASEPETQAVQAYLVNEFPDQRGTDVNDAAPLDATGVYIDIHAYGEQVLWPWGFTGGAAPNGAELQRLGRKLAYFTGYTPEQAAELYPTDGTTDDFAYGTLGVAAISYEIGTTFFQSCPSFESTIVPSNLESLVYAAKVARTPYTTPSGPDVLDLLVVPGLVNPGESVDVVATADDTRYNQSNGVEPTQDVAVVEYTLDVPSWVAGAPTPVILLADDGSFDGPVEQVSGSLDTTGLDGGRHVLFVQGQDADGNEGAVSARFFYIADGTEASVSGVVTDAETGLPLAATVTVDGLALSAQTEAPTGAYTLLVPAGRWTLRAEAADHLEQSVVNLELASSGAAVQDFALPPIPRIILIDDDDNEPDVRAEYTAALDTLGEKYSVWDTANSDNEPPTSTLAPFEVAIWFSGDEYGGAAGPGAAGETTLAGWLTESGCLLLSSQEYHFDRGLTPFMQTYLGAASVVDDVNHSTVNGQGAVFGGLGPYILSFPYSNFTDRVTPDASAEIAFSGSGGDAAVTKDTGVYRAAYWGFGLEGLPTPADRSDVLASFLSWCAALPALDGDADGIANGADCAPSDPTLWAVPSTVIDLEVSRDALDNLTWSPPAEPGAESPTYDVLRAIGSPSFATPACVVSGTTGNSATDDSTAGAGELDFYLVRARSGCGENTGSDSTGAGRVVGSCP